MTRSIINFILTTEPGYYQTQQPITAGRIHHPKWQNMKTNKGFHRQIAIPFLLFQICVIMVSSCKKLNHMIGITPTPTPVIPTSTATPTKRVCPPSTALPSPEINTLKQNLVVFLVDPDQDVLVRSATGIEKYKAVIFLENMLRQIIEPGDRYAILGLGCQTYSCARIINQGSNPVKQPFIPSTPAPNNTLTPVPTLHAGEEKTLFQKTQEAREYLVTATAQMATATQISFNNYCAQKDWTDKYATQSAEWKATKSVMEENFHLEISNQIEDFISLENPEYAGKQDDYIFHGLSYASIILQNECPNYDNCYLVILDDLYTIRLSQDQKPQKPSHLEISFDEVEVLSVLLNCEELYQPSCQITKEVWYEVFNSYGIEKITFHNKRNVEDFLLDHLRR